MRFRGKSIRRKIVALLLVPLVSLTTIWAFATVITGREASHLSDVSSVMEQVGHPVEGAVRVLQQERRQSLVHLADPSGSHGLAALRRSRAATDKAIRNVRSSVAETDVRESLHGGGSDSLHAVLDAFEGIESLRRSVEDGTVSRSQALDLYNRIIDPCYVLLSNLNVVDEAELDKQYRALVTLARARELLSREDALLGSALVTGRLTRAEVRDVSDLVAQRMLLYDVGLPQLPPDERRRYDAFWKNAASAPLRVGEEAAVSSGTGPLRGVTPQSWDTAAGSVLAELGELNDGAADRYQDRVRPAALGVIAEAVIAGVVGLILLLVSLGLSVRVGRGLIRDLKQLRLEAHEASGVRLPGVIRRLSAGERVDIDTEVPRLEYDRNEIGEVGQALNTLQRAAVEAAVKQAELRAGISEVFVNLARRSQVLLHKQLTLLDSMERRTEDSRELADLFRLDHLTTRMRRHAEGLVILSGAAPSRQWRRPIQLMDVVRAAVAEVEDYERIEVRRLPKVAVTGAAVADLTHLVAELLENATVFSPPHNAVQVVGERVGNGFTLEIHDRGLGMPADALTDANLRLAEITEFELSDTDRLGLFVVGRLAQRQNVRVSLQPSPYGGTTAVVFLPDALLTDDVPDTNGAGFRLDRPRRTTGHDPAEKRRGALSQLPVRQPRPPASLLDGPVEPEGPIDLDALEGHPGVLDDEDIEHGGPFRPRATDDEGPVRGHEPEPQGHGAPQVREPGDRTSTRLGNSRRPAPHLVSSHGRPVHRRARDERTGEEAAPSARREEEAAPVRNARRRGEDSAGPRDRDRTDAGQDALSPLPARRRSELLSADHDPELADTETPPPPLPARRRFTTGSDGSDPVRDDTPSPAGPGPEDRPKRQARASRRTPGPATGAPGTDGPTAPPGASETGSAQPGDGSLPRRVRQASLVPQLKRGVTPRNEDGPGPAERDADEVRSRMASLQRGWQRGREENAAGDGTDSGTAPQRTTERDGR